MAESLHGIIERVTFHNADTGFAVLRVQARGQRGLVTVVGMLPRVVAGEYLEADGGWIQDRDHGLQFKAEALRVTPPHTLAGIEKYLASGLIKGIGPHFAHKIVEVFGERTLAVIDESPAFLSEVKGLGPRRIQQIRESWREQKTVRDIMLFLQSHGVGTGRAVRIYRTYGDNALTVVRENPYRLATDIWGVGFQTADQLAERVGIGRDSPLRARAAVRFVLQEQSRAGHVACPEQRLVEETVGLTGIDPGVVSRAVEEERATGEIVRETKHLPDGETSWIYLKPLFMAELGVARGVAALRGKPGRPAAGPLAGVDTDAAIGWVEQRMGLELAPSQRDAIRRAVTEKLVVITGGPGVGKTTIVRGILEIFLAKGRACGLCAPTGRAARRLAESTGQEAKTIHRLLEFDAGMGGFTRSRETPLDLDLLVVDEASMVDVTLMNQLVRALPAWACLVLVGDVDQLPSVGPGSVLADLIASGVVPVARLTEIFRQARESRIVRAAHQIHQGEVPESAPTSDGDFFFIEAADPAQILAKLLAVVRERIPARFGLDPLRDVQVLTPMNRSALGARELNRALQAALNPGDAPGVERFGWTFRVGDKVIQTVNNYQKDVFNGDIGRITGLDPEDQRLTVQFDGRPVEYEFGELDELALAFVTTVHKAQGSEYPAVVVPLHTQHFLMLQRNLLYTAVTRGKKVVVLIGSRKALETAVGREDVNRRYTALAQRLRAQVDRPEASGHAGSEDVADPADEAE